MDLNKNELKTEQLPDSAKVNYLNVLIEQVSNNKNKKKKKMFCFSSYVI